MTHTFGGTPNLLELLELSSARASEIPVSGSDVSFDGSNVGIPSLDAPGLGDGFQHCGLSICEDSKYRASVSICEDGADDSYESDVRLKTDIERVGTTVHGLPLYQFRYTRGPERFEGVMAQDVLDVMPEAVSLGSDGFYRVNYRRLGIEMRPVSGA